MENQDYKKVVRFQDTVNIPVIDNGEVLVEIDPMRVRAQYKKEDMKPFLGDKMLVRQSVVERLYSAQGALQNKYVGLQMMICYAYRTPEIQNKYFQTQLRNVRIKFPDLNEMDQIEVAHSMSAHPDSAGHTCGAALDVTMWDLNKKLELDMGSGVAEFGDKAYTYYPKITEEQKTNRMLLLEFMVEAGFAPFLGEWWHFSYGDKEWACYYKKSNALYGKIEFNAIRVLA